VNRLRWHLLELSPDLERALKRRALNQSRVLDPVDRRPRKLPAGERVMVAQEQVAHIRSMNRQADQLESELFELVKAHRPQLLAELGCGALTAAILIGHRRRQAIPQTLSFGPCVSACEALPRPPRR
jgi:transposase